MGQVLISVTVLWYDQGSKLEHEDDKMMQFLNRCARHSLPWFVLLTILGTSLGVAYQPNANAETKYRRVYDASIKQYVFVPDQSVSQKARNALRNPIVKQSAIGAAVGTATGIISGSGGLKGAGIGAMVGAGTGLIDTSKTLAHKPLIKNALKGAAIGTGASTMMDRSAVKGAAAGAAVGAGLQLFKDFLNRNEQPPAGNH